MYAIRCFRLITNENTLILCFFSLPHPATSTTSCCLCSMPVLKETYIQIKERNRREIRNRTNARVAQLAAEEIRNRSKASEEQFESELESDLPTPSPFSCPSAVPLYHAPQAPDCKFVLIVLVLFSILLSQLLIIILK
jgi:hypothetical protein